MKNKKVENIEKRFCRKKMVGPKDLLGGRFGGLIGMGRSIVQADENKFYSIGLKKASRPVHTKSD